MSEGRTEREALLEARVKELEAAAKASAVSVAEGGVFEAIWRTINKFVTPWLAAAAVGVVLAHYGFEYYMGAQIAAAETQLKQAKSDVENAKADALNGKVGDEPMRLATVRAELEKTQAEAAQAKAEATALSAQENGETMRLATVKAQLANVQNQAALARAKADAASKQSGLMTLRQKEAFYKLVITQMKAAHDRQQAAIVNSSVNNMGAAILRATCEGNQFAKDLGCPARYVQAVAEAPRPAPQANASPGEVKMVPSSPGPAAQASPTYRKPAMFDCSRASMGSDFVICASDQLLDAEARLEDAYKAARASGGESVGKEQVAWIKSYGPDCGLPLRGRPASAQIGGARQCILAAMTKRIGELQGRQ